MATDINKVLGQVSGALGTINTILPAAMMAYTTFYAMWKKANPDKSFEDFNAELLSGAIDVQVFSASWFTEHGYVKDADGNWVKRV